MSITSVFAKYPARKASIRTPRALRKPQPRSLRLLAPINGFGRNGILRITAGKVVETYFLDRAEKGPGYTLEKTGAEAGVIYTVDTNAGTCTCKGHTYHGHCKHQDAVRVLAARGSI